ncbi:hypothetical protein NC653_025173 [Populus alba x Populus x berolinensis]|uniref:Uncharacterized protein n=1 Tax=Populus alba x Populus x berolinensis TaxID=444605 RepID=A0AAD6MAK4_9ROSI|nr:hypothetical protein NC653_025173 [Populus alba x Populus x berolinensis]
MAILGSSSSSDVSPPSLPNSLSWSNNLPSKADEEHQIEHRIHGFYLSILAINIAKQCHRNKVPLVLNIKTIAFHEYIVACLPPFANDASVMSKFAFASSI